MNAEIVNNLLVFLNRVEIQGFDEISAMNQILDVLHSPQDGCAESPQLQLCQEDDVEKQKKYIVVYVERGV